jgi:hypothetical protein
MVQNSESLFLSRSGGSIVGIEEHLVTEQSLDPFQNFAAAALGYGAPLAGIAGCPRQLVGDFLHAHKQHGQPGVGFGNYGAACGPVMTGIARSMTSGSSQLSQWPQPHCSLLRTFATQALSPAICAIVTGYGIIVGDQDPGWHWRVAFDRIFVQFFIVGFHNRSSLWHRGTARLCQ